MELHVAIKPALEHAKKPLEERIRELCERKLIGQNRKIENAAIELLERRTTTESSSREMHKSDQRESVIKAFEKQGVKLMFFRDILRQVKERIEKEKRVCMDPSRRYIQLCSTFLS